MARFNGKRGHFARFGVLSGPKLSIVTGGTLFSSGDYYYRLFASSGSINIDKAPLEAEIMIVAGGGSGATNSYYPKDKGAGGGGGGGLYVMPNSTLGIGDYGAVVGGGGAGPYIGSEYHQANGNNGSNSYFYKIGDAVSMIANGGGGGINGNLGNANGGTSSFNQNGTIQNFSGGIFAKSTYANTVAGGGGASPAMNGNNAVYNYYHSASGSGANGPSNFSEWINAVGVGANGSFSGGGGGQPCLDAFQGPYNQLSSGGNGGGAPGIFKWTGSLTTDPNAVINSGGGAGGYYATIGQSGNGGSGFIIMRYLKSAVE